MPSGQSLSFNLIPQASENYHSPLCSYEFVLDFTRK